MGRIALFIAATLLSACGFHLRGMTTTQRPVWFDCVSIAINQAHHDLKNLLMAQLGANNNTPMCDPHHVHYLLVIENEQYNQDIKNVGASTTPRQYLLTYTVQFTLTELKGKALLTSNQIRVDRQVTINNERILGSNSEEMLIQNEMRVDAAMQIINRMSQVHIHNRQKTAISKANHHVD